LELKKIDKDFSVSKIQNMNGVDFNKEFVFLSKTDEEISLVCESCFVPENPIAVETGWKALKITGILDFGMIGIIAKISDILSHASVSIFVVSTYNTDYIFLKSFNYEKSIALLEKSGYTIK